MNKFGIAAVLSMAFAATGQNADAQSYPNRSIRLVVPIAAGSVTDVAARLMAQELSSHLGGNAVIVENKPGASMVIGGAECAKSPPDGYTLSVVSPDTINASHGADSLRLFLMFLGPLEAMKPWNPKGIEGVHRFLQKVWHDCVGEDGNAHARIVDGHQDSGATLKLLHETIRKVGDDIEGMRFNTAISQMMILENALHKEAQVSRSTTLAFVQILAPFAPHLAEEIWSRLGAPGLASAAPWPAFDAARVSSAEVRIVFQVNGKHRADQLVPLGITQEVALGLAQAHDKVAPVLAGKRVVKVVFVPNRILNLVVA